MGYSPTMGESRAMPAALAEARGSFLGSEMAGGGGEGFKGKESNRDSRGLEKHEKGVRRRGVPRLKTNEIQEHKLRR